MTTAYFDRFDICEAYYCLETDYNVSGVLQERKSNQYRKMSTGYQLHRMDFTPPKNLSFDTLSENGKQIYAEFIVKHNLPLDDLIKSVKDLDQYLPDANLIQADYEVLHTLINIGYLPDIQNDHDWIESDIWIDCEYTTLFILIDKSGCDYAYVWGLSGTPYLYKSVDLIYARNTLLITNI